MRKRAICFLMAAALCMLAPLASALVNGTATILIFPSAGEPSTDYLTCVFREGGMTMLALPEHADEVRGCLRVDMEEIIDLATLDSIRYYGHAQSESILLRNQLTAFRYDSAGVVEIVIEQAPVDGVSRTSFEIVGFTMLEMYEPLAAGDVLYLFYGEGEPAVTLLVSAIINNERMELMRGSVDANEAQPQQFSAGEGDQAVILTARIIPMEEFVAEAPSVVPQ